jgi:hypothetical protein
VAKEHTSAAAPLEAEAEDVAEADELDDDELAPGELDELEEPVADDEVRAALPPLEPHAARSTTAATGSVRSKAR